MKVIVLVIRVQTTWINVDKNVLAEYQIYLMAESVWVFFFPSFSGQFWGTCTFFQASVLCSCCVDD